MSDKRTVLLVIMDGWGIREMESGNAPYLANTPNYDRWTRTLERSIIDASGEAVGLVDGQMGNSEVGHMNLGAGRVIYQDITRIYKSIRENTLRDLDPLKQTFDSGKTVHFIGLVSNGGVHSHIDHLYALLDITREKGINPVLHIITDGRDTPTESGLGFVQELQAYIDKFEHGRIATVSGRYYAMDRDLRWERTKTAYDAIVLHQAAYAADHATQAIEQSYARDVTDEFIEPTIIGDDIKIQSGDAVVFYNFRADRMRQLVRAFTDEAIEGFERVHIPNLTLTTFTNYMDELNVNVVFNKMNLDNTLAQTISEAGLKQYHSAETEKYPHVTFFFNGRREDPFTGEERAMVQSPRDVATYDEKPEMSAYQLTDLTLQRIREHDDDFILVNFANPDMVGHTGSLMAARRACEVVDECVQKLVDAVTAESGVAIVTADHGNAERMVELSTGAPHTYHTINPVPLFVMGEGYYMLKPRGILADVAPTVLDLLGLQKPDIMTGESLIDTWVKEGQQDDTDA